jgi:hypothetical protein
MFFTLLTIGFIKMVSKGMHAKSYEPSKTVHNVNTNVCFTAIKKMVINNHLFNK